MAFNQLQKPLLMHDGGLVVPDFNGFSVVCIKYVSAALIPKDFINLMQDKKDKSCYLMQCLIYVDEKRRLYKFQDKLMR